jgi:hypothetical protein
MFHTEKGDAMKRIITLLLLVLAAVVGLRDRGQARPFEFGISFGVFYNSLDRHGEWINLGSDSYGWRPHGVARGWRPYTYGNWSWTPQGWYWVSDEPWAWAVYHYGRWYHDDYYGWIWIPGYDWAPAWVEWRSGGDYIGWAPLGPYAIFDIHFGISYHRRWVTPYHYWSFVGIRHMGNHGIYRYVQDYRNNRRYIGMTRSTGELRYERDRIVNRGPDRGMIEQRIGRRFREADLVEVRDRNEQNVIRGRDRDEIRVYRPPQEEKGSAGVERPGRVREVERRPNIDLPRTDLQYRGRESRESVDRTAPTPQGPREVNRVEPRAPRRVEEPQRVREPERIREPERPAEPRRVEEPRRVPEPRQSEQPRRLQMPRSYREPATPSAPRVREARPQRVPDQSGSSAGNKGTQRERSGDNRRGSRSR